MAAVVLSALALGAIAGVLIGGHHLYLRLDRPGGFECSLRVTRGTVDGLGPKFRAGYAGPEVEQLLWRRIAWLGSGVRVPITGVRLAEARRPASRERPALPASFTVIPVDVDAETRVELALPTRRVARLVGLITGPEPRPPHR
ncbi:MAG: DUF2550 family protein [Acidimicrobiia bacterium]|nr:DUF2550 family protein [Acidimicrobiia bacterium]